MRIGILGGTFNPIHNTHLDIARAACDRFRLDLLLFIPAKTPPHKRADLDLAPAKDRLAMVALAIASIKSAEVSDLELNRPGPSFTFDTLVALRIRFGPEAEFFFILGSDQLLELPTWRRAAELVRLCRFVSVERPGHSLKSLDALAGKLPEDVLRSLRDDALEMPASTISATDIRRRLAAGEDVSSMVPESVLDYIRQHKLYQPA